MVIYQVKKFLCKYGLKQTYLSQFLHNTRYKSTSAGTLHPLLSRNLLKISGEDTAVFLQGLITNDMKHFDEGAKSMYAMFLNNKGRVLYDTLIYKWGDKDTFMLECDKNVVNLVQKHLKIYKLKRKIDIVDVNTELRVWALITPNLESKLNIDPNDNINIYKDPRLADLGYRIISAVDLNGDQVANIVEGEIITKSVDNDYKYLRYSLGVSEGVVEIEPEISFPLEMNCDYLHGVSFHKGCYIGQELTARVYHTGVIRKRVMPIKFSENVQDFIEKNTIIIDSDNPKTNVGKLKAYRKDYGIGLVRIKEAINAKELKIAKYSVEAVKPSWWPLEAPKEKTLSK